MRVLVIEDNPCFRDELTLTLSRSGNAVVPVRSAEEALHMLQGGFVPEAVVLDLNLPKATGQWFLETVESRALQLATRTVVCSARARRHEEELADLGVPRHQILQKGLFLPHDLRSAVANLGQVFDCYVLPDRPRATDDTKAQVEAMGARVHGTADGALYCTATPSQVERLRASGLAVAAVEELLSIHLPGGEVRTAQPRVQAGNGFVDHPDYVKTESPPPARRKVYPYLVQFHVGPAQAWLDKLTAAGNGSLQPLQQCTVLFECTLARAAQIAKWPSVRWVGEYARHHRIPPAARRTLDASGLSQNLSSTTNALGVGAAGSIRRNSRTSLPERRYLLRFYSGDTAPAKEALKRLKGQVLGILGDPKSDTPSLICRLGPSRDPVQQLLALADCRGVFSVEPCPTWTAASVTAWDLVFPDATQSALVSHFTGDGELIAVADTGLDSGQLDNIHPDLAGRVLKVEPLLPPQLCPGGGVFKGFVHHTGEDRYDGHGTHVAGLIAASPSKTAPCAGVAPGARLIVQALEHHADWSNEYREEYYANHGTLPPPFHLAGLPEDLTEVFQAAFDAQARIHNNSWENSNEESFGLYDEWSRQVDDFVREHPDFLVIFAAGNQGDRGLGTVGSAAAAKNCLTVGASRRIPPRKEIHSAFACVWQEVAAFSSRGPVRHERVKPDLIAPGVDLWSTRSRFMSPYSKGRISSNGLYDCRSGTSMAAPLVAGVAALARQYLRTEHATPSPSAALLKALLINECERSQIPEAPGPALFDFVQGWGHLNAAAVLAPTDGRRSAWLDHQERMQANGYPVEIEVRVLGDRLPLRVTLAWTDYPPESALHLGTGQLVNDLDLEIVNQAGYRYQGNFQAVDLTSRPDRRNNIERVVVRRPPEGRYRIIVRAHSVSRPQDFALVCSGLLDRSGPLSPT